MFKQTGYIKIVFSRLQMRNRVQNETYFLYTEEFHDNVVTLAEYVKSYLLYTIIIYIIYHIYHI